MSDLKFYKTSMPDPVKSLGYIKSYSSSNPRPAESPSKMQLLEDMQLIKKI